MEIIKWPPSPLDTLIHSYYHKRTGRVSFREEGGLKSLSEYFFPLLAQKSSGFAQILPNFPPKWLFEKLGGGGGCSPHPHGPYAYAYYCHCGIQWNLVMTKTFGPWKFPCYIKFLLYQGNTRKIYKELGPAKLPCFLRVLNIRPLYNEVPLYYKTDFFSADNGIKTCIQWWYQELLPPWARIVPRTALWVKEYWLSPKKTFSIINNF